MHILISFSTVLANPIKIQFFMEAKNNPLGDMIFKMKMKSGPKACAVLRKQRTVSAMLAMGYHFEFSPRS
jgi:hypothetical protein